MTDTGPMRYAVADSPGITLLGGTAVGWPLAVRAQQGERVRRIGAKINNSTDNRHGIGGYLDDSVAERILNGLGV